MDASIQNDNFPTIKNLTESQPAPLIDNVGGGVIYTGWASLGSKETDPVWKISKQSVSGTVTRTEYADGDMSYDNVWDDRATLNYTR